MVKFGKSQSLLDIGGGSGAFLRAVGAAYPHLRLALLDLPDVVTGASDADGHITRHPGSFRDDALPAGADKKPPKKRKMDSATNGTKENDGK